MSKMLVYARLRNVQAYTGWRDERFHDNRNYDYEYKKKSQAFYCLGNNKVRKGVSLHSCQLYFLLQFDHAITESIISIHQVFYCLAGVNHRSVVTSAEVFADSF